MKKKILTYTIVLLALFSLQTQAQIEEPEKIELRTPEYESTICLNAGISLIGSLINVSGVLSQDVSTQSIPAIQLTYDRMVVDWLSLGVAASYQMMDIRYRNYTYFDSEGVLRNEDFTTDINRLNFGIRPLLNFGNIDKVDMYSGLRLGFTNWSVKSNSRDPLYNPEDDVDFKSGLTFAPQLILFGLRGYFTENIGGNFELAVGSPHFLSFGLSYRM